MKFTEHLVLAALLVPTAALLAAAVISLTAEAPAPESQSLYNSVLAAYWGLSPVEDQP